MPVSVSRWEKVAGGGAFVNGNQGSESENRALKKGPSGLPFGWRSCILMPMSSCNHRKLVLMEKQGKKYRCRHCHLTIDEKELDGGCCPECLEACGVRRRDFEVLKPEYDGRVLYRCEECGAIIEVD